MEYYSKTAEFAARQFGSDTVRGLTSARAEKNKTKFGDNRLSRKKKRGLLRRTAEALKEPMLIILIFGFIIAFGTALGGYIKTGKADFAECGGIFAAIALSVSITLIMEGSSEKAFAALESIYENVSVKAIRNGVPTVIPKSDLTVGDVIILESGDKIVADGRLIESRDLSVDESALTGESGGAFKNADAALTSGVPLAERKNFVYSGTFVRSGSGKMIVTAVGDGTEMGGIAGELRDKKAENSPLQHKLNKLGKIITATGAATAAAVFAVSAIRLAAAGTLNFDSVRELFISCIILIVAAVPEGLPTIVAVSLALNMIKLARENALIKKMTATEAAGAVSVICSDKTGTLTENKMTVYKICSGEYCESPSALKSRELLENFVCNGTAGYAYEKGKKSLTGSGTECALYAAADKALGGEAEDFRAGFKLKEREPFSSDKKYMITVTERAKKRRALLKGAAEKVLSMCDMPEERKARIIKNAESYGAGAGRVICFAHKDGAAGLPHEGYVFDGFAVLKDPVRKEVKEAVKECRSAGIKVKILTGDNAATALAVAKELGVASSPAQVMSGEYAERADDDALKKALASVTVIARSTPALKLRIVRLLKEQGEVVAVTGDGINDAPAIKRADVGIAMGKTGSEITREAADIILLDDSFATVVRAVAFGRNVYRNLQRFILFQLSVNLSALIFITVCAAAGLKTPFNTLQLLWINVIMDGPPALTLGLERAGKNIMKQKPVRRVESIVSVKMLLRILFAGVFIAAVLLMQYLFDFLKAGSAQRSAVFTLFILFQLFNAFNCRELGAESIFGRLGRNKVMAATFAGVFVIHFIIVQAGYNLFGITPMSAGLWIRCILTAFSVITVSECYKLIYRLIISGKTAKSAIYSSAGLK